MERLNRMSRLAAASLLVLLPSIATCDVVRPLQSASVPQKGQDGPAFCCSSSISADGTCMRSQEACVRGCLRGPCIPPTPSHPRESPHLVNASAHAAPPLQGGGSPAPAPSPQPPHGEKWTPWTLNTPFLVAIVLGAAGGLGFLLLLLICMCGRTAHPWDRPLKGSLFRKYRLREVQAMTNSFSDSCVVRRGALWTAYCGRARDGSPCAVKAHRQVTQYAYEKEVMAAQRLRHKNLVNLLGYCVERGHHILVYAYDPYKSLQERLHGAEQTYAVMTVQRRLSVALGVAEGVQHLHSNGYFHVDVIPTNIWVDREGTAKLADLGFLKEAERVTAAPKRGPPTTNLVHPTPEPVLDIEGYLDPEYGVKHRHGWRVDVYRLGVLLLELLTGRRPLVGEKDQESALHLLLNGSTHRLNPLPPPLDHLSWIQPDADKTGTRNAIVGPTGAQAQKKAPAMHIRQWAGALLSAGDPGALLDPRIVQAEAANASAVPARPGSTESELRRQVLGAYFSLALRCTGPAEQRPLPRFVISELAGLCRLWRASSMALLAHPGESGSTSLAPSEAWDSVQSGRDPSSGHMSSSHGGIEHLEQGVHAESAEYRPPRCTVQGEVETPGGGSLVWYKTAEDSCGNGDSSFFTPVSSGAGTVSHSCSLARSTALLEASSSAAVPPRRQIPPRTVKAIVRELVHSGVRVGAVLSADADTTFSLQPSTMTSHCSSFTGTGLSQGTAITCAAAPLPGCTTMNTRAPTTVLSSCTTMNTRAPTTVLSSSPTIINTSAEAPLSGCTTMNTRAPTTVLPSCAGMNAADDAFVTSKSGGSGSVGSVSTGSAFVGATTDENSTESPLTAPHTLRAIVRRLIG